MPGLILDNRLRRRVKISEVNKLVTGLENKSSKEQLRKLALLSLKRRLRVCCLVLYN